MRVLRLVSVVISVTVIAATFARAEQVASLPAPTGYINDYANVLSDAGKSRADAVCHDVHAKTKAQIFVVTIQSLEDNSITTFANDLFHQWKIGERKTDRGVLLLFAVKEHKWRIEVGYGLEGILNDAKVGRIGRDMVPLLKQSDYDAAVSTGVDAVAKVIADDAGVSLAPPPPASPPEPVPAIAPAADVPGHSGFSISSLVPFLLFFGIFGFVILVSIRNRRRGYYGMTSRNDGPSNTYFDPGGQTGFIAGESANNFGSDDTSSSSSADTSSSSDSFSGGDGGDSGGGGADGSW